MTENHTTLKWRHLCGDIDNISLLPSGI